MLQRVLIRYYAECVLSLRRLHPPVPKIWVADIAVGVEAARELTYRAAWCKDQKRNYMREAAMDLIRKSATQASAKLQFARLAFGAAGSAGAEIDLRDAEKVSREFVAGTGKHEVIWEGPVVTLPKNQVKALLNLVALGVVALPRGGTVSVEIAGNPPEAVSFTVRAKGKAARLNEQVTALLSGSNGVEIDAHSIQPYYASRVATAAGLSLTAQAEDDEVTLKGA